jgi:DNA replication protein DnaC
MNTIASARSAADAARLPLMLGELRLPTMKRLWADLAEQSNREGWPAERFLGVLLEQESTSARRAGLRAHASTATCRRTRAWQASTSTQFRQSPRPMSRRWPRPLAQGHNFLAFGRRGVGKTHLIAGIGHALIDHGYKVLFVRTSALVQRLQAARRDLRLPNELAKLDRFDLIILDDLSYARRDQAETSVLFELIGERYERKSIAITANAPFSAWDEIFPDKAMTIAAVDRLVHHATAAALRCRLAGNAAQR